MCCEDDVTGRGLKYAIVKKDRMGVPKTMYCVPEDLSRNLMSGVIYREGFVLSNHVP